MKNWKKFNAETEFDFGAHTGRTLEEVMSNHAAYILWCIREIEWFLIDLELLESYVGKYDRFVNAKDSISNKKVDINLNPFSLSEELKDLLTDKWNKYKLSSGNLGINRANNAGSQLINNNTTTMKTVLIQRFTEEEQEINSRLLSTFETMFSANAFNKLKGILHSEGTYFGKMNREKACGHFYNIFFGKDGCSEKFNMEVNKGISMDHIPGEVVLELRCSDFNPFTDDADRLNKEFGEAPDLSINELIYRFAFSFKEEKISSIRIPRKCVSVINNIVQNN